MSVCEKCRRVSLSNSKLCSVCKNEYKYGEDFEMDELRASANISKILKGEVKRKKKVKKRPVALDTP